MNMTKFDGIFTRVFLWGLPFVTLIAIGLSIIDKDTISSDSLANSFNSFAGLVFCTWISFSLYIGSRIVFSRTTRKLLLSRLVFLKDGDEREANLTGVATKEIYLVNLAILILMLCFSVFQISVVQLPPGSAPEGKSRSLSLGISLNLLEEVDNKTQPKRGASDVFRYTELPFTKTAIILFFIIWQIAFYNYLMRRYFRYGSPESS
jgi:hypothetical protein